MTLGILKEADGEQRVSVTPDSLSALTKMGFDKIIVERGAAFGQRLAIVHPRHHRQQQRKASHLVQFLIIGAVRIRNGQAQPLARLFGRQQPEITLVAHARVPVVNDRPNGSDATQPSA